MSLFSAILDKLGFSHKADVSATPGTTPGTAPDSASAGDAVPPASATPATPAPAAMSQVDVMSKLEAMAAASPQKSIWKVSIADLLRLLGLDSSLEARKGLAMELGCPKEFIGGDYAQMNMWLHKTVLQRLAANGGNIPKELL